MKSSLTKLILVINFIIGISIGVSASNANQNDSLAIQKVVENYKLSINKVDTILAKSIWENTPEISFIHPRGHEIGWEGIKKGIYEMFGTRFSVRDLKSYNESFTIYDDMAVVVFYWIFDATYTGENPSQMQSKGRETQIMKKTGSAWRIVHVHYSGMPKTGAREGF
jgi:ketosteroid isomerase-like protein